MQYLKPDSNQGRASQKELCCALYQDILFGTQQSNIFAPQPHAQYLIKQRQGLIPCLINVPVQKYPLLYIPQFSLYFHCRESVHMYNNYSRLVELLA